MELRKDYIRDRWVIINPKRGLRPHQFKEESKPASASKETCFFCPGNEKLTPDEIGRIPDGKSWKMRWFDNKFAVVSLEGNPHPRTDNRYFTFGSAYGKHEIVVETPDHIKQLWDLDKNDLFALFKVYNERIEELGKIPHIKYVSVFKNHGKGAGTSLEHSHSQIVAYNMLPSKIQKEIEAIKNYDHCPYCDIINIEKDSLRQVWVNENVVAFCPYASRFQYGAWIFPRRHVSRLSEMRDDELRDFVTALAKVLKKLKSINADFNYFLNYSPEGHDLHFHVRINPRLSIWAGFEYSTDAIINTVSPEDAAKFYNEP